MKGYVEDCSLMPRDGDILFHIDVDASTVTPMLRGYAILPIEQFEAMTSRLRELETPAGCPSAK